MGQITGKDNNRTPTVQACNDAYGFDAGSISGDHMILIGSCVLYYTSRFENNFKRYRPN